MWKFSKKILVSDSFTPISWNKKKGENVSHDEKSSRCLCKRYARSKSLGHHFQAALTSSLAHIQPAPEVPHGMCLFSLLMHAARAEEEAKKQAKKTKRNKD